MMWGVNTHGNVNTRWCGRGYDENEKLSLVFWRLFALAQAHLIIPMEMRKEGRSTD